MACLIGYMKVVPYEEVLEKQMNCFPQFYEWQLMLDFDMLLPWVVGFSFSFSSLNNFWEDLNFCCLVMLCPKDTGRDAGLSQSLRMVWCLVCNV